MADEQQPSEPSGPTTLSWSEFLESYPLNTGHLVAGYYGKNPDVNPRGSKFIRLAPALRLYCSVCEGVRNFTGKWDVLSQNFSTLHYDVSINAFLQYTCKDCEKGYKTFCLRSAATPQMGVGFAIKLSELPESHVDLPRSLKSLLDDDYEPLSERSKM